MLGPPRLTTPLKKVLFISIIDRYGKKSGEGDISTSSRDRIKFDGKTRDSSARKVPPVSSRNE